MNMLFRCRLFLIISFLVASKNIKAQFSTNIPRSGHQFVVVAHRGDHTRAPENTLAAFEQAIKAGVDYVEIDLRTTLDSQLVIMHDASVDRMTDGKGFVKDLTFAAIRKLKVRDKMNPGWGEFNIPSFKEVLELCRGRINIYLDFKDASPAAAYKEIVQYGMEENVLVYINKEQQFYQWRKTAPDMPLMISLPSGIRDSAGMRTFLDPIHPEVLDGSYDQYTADMVSIAGKLGYLVLPDIQGINENPSLWDSAIQKGIRGLQTDHPQSLIRYLQEKGIR